MNIFTYIFLWVTYTSYWMLPCGCMQGRFCVTCSTRGIAESCQRPNRASQRSSCALSKQKAWFGKCRESTRTLSAAGNEKLPHTYVSVQRRSMERLKRKKTADSQRWELLLMCENIENSQWKTTSHQNTSGNTVNYTLFQWSLIYHSMCTA